ncbi:MAG: esterase family protein [Clostridia bacterium]|nr:esterase family protein [Clostridia bacterium]
MALLHTDFFSNTLGMCVQMDVILPQRTTGQIGMEGSVRAGKYPTLYLLHGLSDDHTIWQRRTSIERYVSDLGIAVVMPCTHRSWYTDTFTGMNYWTYISQELVETCRDFFPNMSSEREQTWAAGLSMGGYGALKLGLRASETFSKVASLSGAVDIAGLVKPLSAERLSYWETVFGPKEKLAGSFNDLFAAAEELKASGKPLPEIFMWCGTEDGLLEGNIAMREHLEKLGYNVTYSQSPGDHQWCYWDEQIQNVLKWMTR